MLKLQSIKQVYRVNQNMGFGRYDVWYIYRSKFSAVMKMAELQLQYPNCCFTLGIQELR